MKSVCDCAVYDSCAVKARGGDNTPIGLRDFFSCSLRVYNMRILQKVGGKMKLKDTFAFVQKVLKSMHFS